MSHFVLELEVILTQQPVFKVSLPVILTWEDTYEQKRNFRRTLDKCKDSYFEWSNSQEEYTSVLTPPKYLLGESGLVEEFLNRVESLIEDNIDLPSGITYGVFIGQDLFYQVSVKEM